MRFITTSLLLVALPNFAFAAQDSEFDKFDLNRDRVLNASEFVAANYSIADFKSADSNQNQRVNVTEFAAFVTAQRKPPARQSSGPHPPRG